LPVVVLHPIDRQLLGGPLEHLDRQFIDAEMIDVQYDNPLLHLPSHEHIMSDIPAEEVVQRTK
jgi:hypothetical protein